MPTFIPQIAENLERNPRYTLRLQDHHTLQFSIYAGAHQCSPRKETLRNAFPRTRHARIVHNHCQTSARIFSPLPAMELRIAGRARQVECIIRSLLPSYLKLPTLVQQIAENRERKPSLYTKTPLHHTLQFFMHPGARQCAPRKGNSTKHISARTRHVHIVLN